MPPFEIENLQSLKQWEGREFPFDGCIAHGFLTLSLLSHFLRQAVQVRSGVAMSINYGLNKVRFPSPVRAGSAIRARVSLLSVKESPEFLDATFLIHVEAQSSEKPCCVAEWLV